MSRWAGAVRRGSVGAWAVVLTLAAGGSACLGPASGAGAASGPDRSGECTARPAPPKDLPRLEMGAPRTLLTSGALGMRYFPDEGTSLISGPPNVRLVMTAERSTFLVEGADVEHLTKATEVLRRGGPGSFDNGYAGISAVVPVGDTLYGYYHAEDQEDLPGLPGGIPGFYASIGVATSRDGGRTWTKQGQVLRSSKPKSWQAYPQQGDRGVAEPGAVKTPDGSALLLYFTEHSRVDGRGVDIGVAKADLRDGPPGVGAFRKYHQGAFSEPGLGGADTAIVTAEKFDRAGVLEAHVTWSAAAGRYLMVVGVDAWAERMAGRPPCTSGLYAAWSSDGVHFSDLYPLILDQAVPQAGRSLTWEASVLWDDDTGRSGWLVTATRRSGDRHRTTWWGVD